MKTLALVALAVIVIAVLAGLAIWPAVADAPWEQEASAPVVEDTTDEIRCEGALDLREAVIDAGQYRNGSSGKLTGAEFDNQMDKAEREIARFC